MELNTISGLAIAGVICSVTKMLEDGLSPEEIALKGLKGLDGEILDSWEAQYYCDCSRERTEQVLDVYKRQRITLCPLSSAQPQEKWQRSAYSAMIIPLPTALV